MSDTSLPELWSVFARYIYKKLDMADVPHDEIILLEGGETMLVKPSENNPYWHFFEDQQHLARLLLEFGLILVNASKAGDELEIKRLPRSGGS